MISKNIMNKSEELHLCNGAMLIYFGYELNVSNNNINYSNDSCNSNDNSKLNAKFSNINKNDGVGSIVLLDGTASAEFTSMNRNVRYSFSHQYVYLETITQARIRIEGMYTYVRTSYDANMSEIHTLLELERWSVSTLHVAPSCSENTAQTTTLEVKREQICTGTTPRVMIVGNDENCKLHVVYSLLNLATRGKGDIAVVYVNADVSAQNALRCPGSISTVFVNEPLEIDEPFNQHAALTFFFGFCDVSSMSRKRYLDLCAYTAESVESAMNANRELKRGGLILHTMSTHTDFELDLLQQLMHIFKITHIILCEPNLILEDALNKMIVSRPMCTLRYNITYLCQLWQTFESYKMRHDANNGHLSEQALLEVWKRSSESVLPSHLLTTYSRKEEHISLFVSKLLRLVNVTSHIDQIGLLVHRYFFGTPRTPLVPFHGIADLDQVILVDANSLQPVGTKPIAANSLAAVVWADNLSRVPEANVAGFIVITEKGRRRFSFLSPASGTLPSAYILISPAITVPQWCIPPVQAS